jgi:tight adherence protein C
VTFVLIALCGASGVVLLWLGLSGVREGRIERRVEPYLSGLRGRPSGLLAPTAVSSGAGRWLEAHWARWRPGYDRELSDRLAAAGDRRAPGEFRVEQLTWGIAASIAAAWGIPGAISVAGAAVDLRAVPALAVVAFAAGWLGRDWWLGRQISDRRAALGEQLPTAIDLVTLSIMAGESVPAAFDRVARTIEGGIGEEFRLVVGEIRSGSPALDALEALKARLPDYSMVRFVDALCTGIERGAPLADVLRAQADDVREARRRRLIEMGGKREVLMLLPVVFLIMPVVVVFVLLPGLTSLDLLVP